MNRALDVETCHDEKINANLLSIFQLLPAEVRETERTTLNVNVGLCVDRNESKIIVNC